jgi:hypothetical protein
VVFLARWFAGTGGALARQSGDKLHGGELGMAWRASLGIEREKGSAALYRGGEGVQAPGRRKWWPRPLTPKWRPFPSHGINGERENGGRGEETVTGSKSRGGLGPEAWARSARLATRGLAQGAVTWLLAAWAGKGSEGRPRVPGQWGPRQREGEGVPSGGGLEEREGARANGPVWLV